MYFLLHAIYLRGLGTRSKNFVALMVFNVAMILRKMFY